MRLLMVAGVLAACWSLSYMLYFGWTQGDDMNGHMKRFAIAPLVLPGNPQLRLTSMIKSSNKVCAVLLVAFSASQANAQQACTYDRCALRLEVGKVVVGATGSEQYRLKPFSVPPLQMRLAISDSAAAHFDVFASNHVSGNVWGLISGLSLAAIISLGSESPVSRNDGLFIGSAAVGLVTGIVSTYKLKKAQNALARSIWWYNRELPRP